MIVKPRGQAYLSPFIPWAALHPILTSVRFVFARIGLEQPYTIPSAFILFFLFPKDSCSSKSNNSCLKLRGYNLWWGSCKRVLREVTRPTNFVRIFFFFLYVLFCTWYCIKSKEYLCSVLFSSVIYVIRYTRTREIHSTVSSLKSSWHYWFTVTSDSYFNWFIYYYVDFFLLQ